MQQYIDEIATVDLTFIVAKTQRKQSWTDERTKLAETQYRNYLAVIRYLDANNQPLDVAPPSQDADEIWHNHILDSFKYLNDCNKVFGFFLHHLPSYNAEREAMGLGAAVQEQAQLDAAIAKSDQLMDKFFPCTEAGSKAGCIPCFAMVKTETAKVSKDAICFAAVKKEAPVKLGALCLSLKEKAEELRQQEAFCHCFKQVPLVA
jgi:hypothetical protein